MKREILFRGKRVDNGEWVYGNLLCNSSATRIVERTHIIHGDNCELTDFHNVHPETVQQYTGFTDKNGNNVFEGDFDTNNDVVVWCEERNGWAMKVYDFPTKEIMFCHCYNCEGNFELYEITTDIEITGNIHETFKTDKG
jgi:uncharacterized phage protein (TIGR01671 family)